MKICKKCTGRGVHFLTCPKVNLKPGWLERLAEANEIEEDDDELTES